MAKTSSFDFKKLFRDADKYPDDMTLSINGEDVPLSVLRAWNTENEGALVKALDKEKLELRAEQQKVQNAATQVADMFVNLEREKAKLQAITPAGNKKDPLDEVLDDPIAGTVAKQLKEFRESITNELKNIKEQELAKINKSIAEMGVTYMNDRAQREFDELGDRSELAPDLSLESLYKYAVDNNHLHKNRLPNLRKAYDEITAPKRQEKLLKEAEERGMKKAQDEQKKAAMMPRPGAFDRVNPGKDKVVPKTLDEAISAAAQDVGIWTGQTGEA